jgi:hypothetical protein
MRSVWMNVKMDHDERIDVFAFEFPLMFTVLRQADLPEPAFISDPGPNYVPSAP